jgi:hypothetical protein
VDAAAGWRIHPPGGYVLSTIGRFRQQLDEYGFPVTARVAFALEPIQAELEGTEVGATLTPDQAARIQSLGKSLQTTLYAEAAGKVACFATDKRYDVDRLLDRVGTLLSPGTFERLSSLAQYDLGEAGICIAFERPTAAAFHVLRATEEDAPPLLQMRRSHKAYH